MTYKQKTVRALYKKLLTFYPRTFKARLGESMEQTFSNLCNERQQTKNELFGFVLWTFAETAMGIIREHVLLITEGAAMKNIFTNLRSPAIISLTLLIPFMILELANRRNFHEGFPILLFGILWFLSIAFIAIAKSIVQNLRVGNSIMANPPGLLLRVVILTFIVWIWFGVLIDQMPCFLGVPNCD